MSTDTDAIRISCEPPVLLITIDRPECRNAVNDDVAQGMEAGLDLLEDDPELHVAIITGSGGTFCAGLDLKARAAGESSRTERGGFAGIVQRRTRKPLVAAVEGWALGGGFEIALACDLVVADESARFGLPEVTRGLIARGGGAFRLPQRIPFTRALEMLLTGSPITAREAEQLALVTRVCPPGTAVAHARRLAEAIGRNAPVAVQASKQIAYESVGWSADEGFHRQAQYVEQVFSSADAAEGAAAFLEKRPPVWRGR